MYSNIDALPLGKLLQVKSGSGKQNKLQTSKDPGTLISQLFDKMPPTKKK